MNLDFALCNRALLNIGMAPITKEDKEAKNEAWLTARDYYLVTMLEALSRVEWTGAKRRRELCPAQMTFMRNSDFAYAYDLPIDCVKVIELDGQAYFEVEAFCLYTDENPARLLYVSNGRRLIDRKWLNAGDAEREFDYDYFTGGDAGRVRRYELGDNVIFGGGAKRPEVPPRAPERDEDFPHYRRLRLEPLFYLYWENLLSAKYALRLTDKPDLAMLFYNKAMVIGKEAEVTSIEHSAARMKASPTWQEELGLG